MCRNMERQREREDETDRYKVWERNDKKIILAHSRVFPQLVLPTTITQYIHIYITKVIEG